MNYDEANVQALSSSLTVFRPDTKWRRSWRERHSLNFFVNFSAPQMAGFFDSVFWQQMVFAPFRVRGSPAISEAIKLLRRWLDPVAFRPF